MEKFTPDEDVWEYAGANGFAIVTADEDFLSLVEQRGAPPKIVRLERCDYKTGMIEQLLRSNVVRIAELESSPRDILIIRHPAK